MLARSLAQEQQQNCYPEYLYMPYPTTNSYDSYQPGKRVKLEQPTIPYFSHSLDTSGFDLAFSGNMQQNQLVHGLNVTPHINLQRGSASPVTVATTVSQNSTPSRSPSRVSIISDSTAPDWVLFDEHLNSTLGNDQPKNKASQPNTTSTTSTQSQLSSYPLQMETALSNGYYAGFPTDFPKLPHQQYLSPFASTYHHLPHQHSHTSEDEPPALSPSNRYQSSGQQSIYESDIRSPMTPIGSPRSIDGDRMSTARTPITHIQNQTPKLHRTISDAVEDELFRSSNMEAPKKQRQKANNTNTNTLSSFYQKAQNDHAMEARHAAPNQLHVPRGDSPFRANSPFHPLRTPQTTVSAPTRHSNFHPYMTFQGRREHQKELDAQTMNEHMMAEAEHLVSTPKTISPKDAVLEYPEPEDEASKMSLFAHDQHYGNGNVHHHHHHHHPANNSYNGQELSDDLNDRSYDLSTSRRGSEAESLSSVGAYSFHTSPQLPLLPSNFPFHSQSLESAPVAAPVMIGDHHYAKPSSPIVKPEGAKADTGAYTCTATGCQQRFASHQKLQKHKRENHRQSTPVGAAGMTSTLHGTRPQGPHRCTRINPTTGKPCNTVFSRPYDLTRHEDTIHNTTREKVRCEICNDEKTFSRQDALTRHKKVKHGIEK